MNGGREDRIAGDGDDKEGAKREEHPDTLSSINNLAFAMKQYGRRMDAIKLMTECLQLRNQVLSPEHPHTLSSTTALAEWQSAARFRNSKQLLYQEERPCQEGDSDLDSYESGDGLGGALNGMRFGKPFRQH
jgi:hypothetical protein